MKNIIILQARLNSKRLPKKVLMEINGYPLIVIAARRVEMSNARLVVAIPNSKSNDELAKKLELFKISYFRGEEKNVLKRFLNATKNYQNDTNIIRLTSDNIFPDKNLIREMLDYFNKKKPDLLTSTHLESGLPYGCSVEIFKLNLLRKANNETKDPLDLEHVTRYIHLNFKVLKFTKYKSLNCGHLRCTIDEELDYIKIKSIFQNCHNIIDLNFKKMIKNLRDFENLKNKIIKDKFILGSVQLGLDYGILRSKKPNIKKFNQLVDLFHSHYGNEIDTARNYGNAELSIGKLKKSKYHFLITTKIKITKNKNLKYFEKKVFNSFERLKTKKLHVLMFHNIIKDNSIILNYLNKLENLKKIGKIKYIGASIQSTSELNFVLKYPQITHIQMPFNVLDNRWVNIIPKIIKEKKKRKLIIIARSIYLQGLLITEEKKLWKLANVSNNQKVIEWLKKMTNIMNCSDIKELCFRYVNSTKWIDKIVIGNNNPQHLNDNINLMLKKCFKIKELRIIENQKPNLSENVLNPALWSK